MINSNTQEKLNNMIFSLLVVLGVYALGAYFFDFFYDLNDDMVIKDILAGVYSGVPDGHTNQMLYPLGFVISCFYRLLPNVPVFGIFLCTCFGICFWMISYGVQSFFKSVKVKAIITVLFIGIFSSLMLWELVYVQYSVVCGVLAGTACFWFYITPINSSVKEYWKWNIPTLLLVWLAFNVRSEMLLLTTPFIATAGIWHWMEAAKEEKEQKISIGNTKIWNYVFSKKNILKYIGLISAILAGLLVLTGADHLAYRNQGWQEYRKFFDARTDVYDYNWYPQYQENKGFYIEHGISKVQYKLIDNYNFGLDESITENTLKDIAFFKERPKMLGSIGYRIKSSVLELIKQFFSFKDMPYACFVFVGYGLVIGMAIVQKNREYYWKLLLLLGMRCIPWFYLIFVQRALPRITHPLYVIEFLLLLAMLVRELYDRPLWNIEKYYRAIVAGILMLCVIGCFPTVFYRVKSEQVLREQSLEQQKLWDDYAKENPENYYYLDVYSTVNFMEKMFKDVDNSQKNYDLLGGWICHSPLQQEARKKYVIEIAEKESSSSEEDILEQEVKSIAEALLTDNFYFVAEKSCDITFMKEFYASEGIIVRLEVTDSVGEGENPFLVYKIVKK